MVKEWQCCQKPAGLSLTAQERACRATRQVLQQNMLRLSGVHHGTSPVLLEESLCHRHVVWCCHLHAIGSNQTMASNT